MNLRIVEGNPENTEPSEYWAQLENQDKVIMLG